jgi:hypothetical protein
MGVKTGRSGCCGMIHLFLNAVSLYFSGFADTRSSRVYHQKFICELCERHRPRRSGKSMPGDVSKAKRYVIFSQKMTIFLALFDQKRNILKNRQKDDSISLLSGSVQI